MSQEKIRGRCYCGKVQFAITPPTKMFSHCHCESCRRSHGAAFVSWTSVDKQQFQMEQGDALIAGYESSPGIVWKFCQNCGTSLFQTTEKTSDTVYVVSSSLIDAMDRPVEGHFSFEEKVSWLQVNDELPKYVGKTSDLIRSREGLVDSNTGVPNVVKKDDRR